MKRISILLFFIALMMPPCHEPGTSMAQQCSDDQVARLTLPNVGGGAPVASPATDKYFGFNTNKDAPTGGAYVDGRNLGIKIVTPSSGGSFTCPGNGAQTLVELGVYGYRDSSADAVYRCSIYTTSNVLVAYGSSTLLFDTSAAWNVHTTFTWANGYTSLTGGTAYKFAVSAATGNGFNAVIYYVSGDSGSSFYQTADWATTGNFPDPLNDASSSTYSESIIVKVNGPD